MGKITLSDFIISLCDLAEAESRALQQSVQQFLFLERQAIQRMLLRSSYAAVFIGAAAICLLAVLVCMTWGIHELCAVYISPLAAPFIAGAVWLAAALTFFLLAKRNVSSGE